MQEMNVYQELARRRLARRFSSGDGVEVLTGPHKGRKGWIYAMGGYSATQDPALKGHRYSVAFTDNPNDPHHLEGGTFADAELKSDPAGNRGKYGGPSRGGSPEGWSGTSRYRSHGRRR